MTFTYSTANLTTPLAQVRLRIGDTDSNLQLLQDEEINVALATHANAVLPTAIACVRLILARIARDVDTSHAGVSAQRDQKTQHYRDLLKMLTDESAEDLTTTPEIHYTGSVLGDLGFEPLAARLGRDRYS